MTSEVTTCEAELNRLRARVALLEAALNEIGDHVAIVDPERRLVFANQAIENSLGREIERTGIDENLALVETRDETRTAPFAMADAFTQALGGERTPQISTWMRDRLTGRNRFLVGDIRPLVIAGQLQAAMALARDVTEEHQAQTAIAWERDRFELVVQGSSSGIWDWNITTNETYFSERYLSLLGYGPHDEPLTFDTWRKALHPYDRARVLDLVEASHNGQREYDLAYRLMTKCGEYRWFRASGATEFNAEGRAVRMAGSITDVHEQRLAEDALRSSEDRFRAFMDHSPSIQWIKDAAGRYVYVNRTFEKHYQLFDRDILGKTDAELWSPEIATQYADNDKAVLRTGQAVEMIENSCDPDGTIRYWKVCKFLLLDTAGDRYTGGIGLDVTDHKLAEDQLRRSREELEQRVEERTHELAESNLALRQEIADRMQAELVRNQLLTKVVTLEEDQRRRIARELHDEFGQLLIGLGMGLSRLREAWPLDEKHAFEITKLQAIVEQMGDSARHLAAEIRPMALDDHGLLAALENYTSHWTLHTDIVVDMEVTDFSPEHLTVPMTTAIYRIAQEGLTNVAKHARATRVGLILRQSPRELSLIIEDNGIGFSPAMETKLTGTRWGLRGIRERVDVLDGSFEIESSAGNGTTLFIKLPLKKAD
ncbi:MAG: PAS domain-containing protein [Planctomycetaceae bacterium]|nr:PAS domain-containing protein [Planctomycetaceae bacterium]